MFDSNVTPKNPNHGIDELNNDQFRDFACGNMTLNRSQPIAAIYAGHQFGHFVSQLGDGRAILRSSIREYLCSEAMYGLGIQPLVHWQWSIVKKKLGLFEQHSDAITL